MENDIPKMQPLQRREDIFGDFYIMAEEFERENGTRGWHIMSWSGANPGRAYWVENGEFHKVSLPTQASDDVDIQLEIGEVLADVSAPERDTVLHAIESWSQPSRQSLSAVSGL